MLDRSLQSKLQNNWEGKVQGKWAEWVWVAPEAWEGNLNFVINGGD